MKNLSLEDLDCFVDAWLRPAGFMMSLYIALRERGIDMFSEIGAFFQSSLL
ncbi:hypothetical protein [Solemya pervernicosa gill symbiont]|uniref:hypothetical protein n=1 Tax=Solemya pervernicosa gill symbiont TaxID=642797 RepID=UPI001560793A|nr:hypothetical protein [Solemya pervernicosa gill symbiont]